MREAGGVGVGEEVGGGGEGGSKGGAEGGKVGECESAMCGVHGLAYLASRHIEQVGAALLQKEKVGWTDTVKEKAH
jgi:hypothetical protein